MSSFTQVEASILQSLSELQLQFGELSDQLGSLEILSDLKEDVSGLRESVDAIIKQKDFYSTREVAELMDVTRHTVQVRWCAEGRIQCEKDPTTGRWRIPGTEYDRLRRGGKPDLGC